MRWLVGLTIMLAARPCSADDAAKKEQAREHYDRGTSLFAIERYDEAIKEFEEAYVALPRPDFLYNIGQAHKRAGRPDKARAYFERYLELAPGAPDRAEVEKLIAETRPPPAQPPSPAEVAPSSPPPPPVAAAAAPPVPAPERRRTWIWPAIIGGAVVVAGAVTLGVVFGMRGP